MGRYRLIREWGGAVEIHNPSPSIRKVMRLAGLDRIASIHSSPQRRSEQHENGGKLMKVLNEMKLSFPSRSANEAFARMALSAFTAALDPTIEELADIKRR